MEIIKKEIKNMEKIVENMSHLNDKFMPNYKKSQLY